MDSLAELEARLGWFYSADPSLFTEWTTDLPSLTLAERQRLDLINPR